MPDPFLKRFPGVIAFPVTPFTREGLFDEEAFKDNVDSLLATGLSAMAFCGSNGEMHSLTLDEYERIAELAGGRVAGRKGLIFGVGQNLRTAVEQTRLARDADADAVMVMAPYCADLGEEGLADYYRGVAEAAGLPVILYQTKWSGLLPLSLLEKLAPVRNIVMIKDEFGSISHYWSVREAFGDRFFWVNGMAEPYVPSYWNLGVTTFTSGLACFMPLITLEIFELARQGRFDRVAGLLGEVVIPLYEVRTRRPGYKCSMIKAAMNLAGLRGGWVRPPLRELLPEDLHDLEEIMTRRGLINSRANA